MGASVAVGILDRVLGRRDPAARERLTRAAAAVDRELAANLELSAMFDQTKQAVVFENAEFARHRAVLEGDLGGEPFREIARVYERLPETETAMERRGPAGSIRPEDRALVESWEGDVRAAQRALRSAATASPSLWTALGTRLRGRKRTER